MQEFSSLDLVCSAGPGWALTQQCLPHTNKLLRAAEAAPSSATQPGASNCVVETGLAILQFPHHSSPLQHQSGLSYAHYALLMVHAKATSKQVTHLSLDLVMILSRASASLGTWKDMKKRKTETNLPWNFAQTGKVQGFCSVHWHRFERDYVCSEATEASLLLRTGEERYHPSVPAPVKLCFKMHTYKMGCVMLPKVPRKPVNP